MHHNYKIEKASLARYETIKAIPCLNSERIKKKFEILAISKAALIEAPSGYGKTTAVRNYLKKAPGNGEDVFWLTAVDEEPSALYRRFYTEIKKIDSNAGKRLEQAGFPNAFTIGEICEALRAMKSERATWLVLDDFHFLIKAFPTAMLTALLCRDSDALRILAVTQAAGKAFIAAVAGFGLPHIKAADLKWDAKEIREYFSIAGADIPREAAVEIEALTGGWIIAVHLQLCAWLETGELSDKAIYRLMDNLIWRKLSDKQQVFLMKASPFAAGTVQQLCALLDCTRLPEYASECVAIPFLKYFSSQERYEAHEILQKYISSKRREQGEDFDKQCLKAAGNLCKSDGNIAQALGFYAQTEDYESVLALNLSELTNTQLVDGSFYDIAIKIAKNCPLNIRRNYPLSMMHIAWAIRLMDNDNEIFDNLMKELDAILPEDGFLRAEWLLLSVYLHYPDLKKMLPILNAAADAYDGKKSQIILPESPWAFYEYLQLNAFHKNIGEADREADMLEEFLSQYTVVTGGHGSGADALFRAELAFCRCQTAKAEVLAYKAVFLSESKNQKIIQIGAARLLASIAVFKAEPDGWKHALNAIEHAAHGLQQNAAALRAVIEVSRATLFAELRDFNHVADWMKNSQFMSEKLPASIKRNALVVHVLFLTSQKDFARMIGLGQAFSKDSFSIFSEYLHSILMAVGLSSVGDVAQAKHCLELSAKKAIPDNMLHFFAGFSRLLHGLSDELIMEHYPHLHDEYSEYKQQYIAGWKILHQVFVEDTLSQGLTEREREIAELAADGLRNQEIAQMLFVSENTVRAHLRSIYQKLDIDRRAKLIKVLK